MDKRNTPGDELTDESCGMVLTDKAEAKLNGGK